MSLLSYFAKSRAVHASIAIAFYAFSASATELATCLSNSGGIYSESDCRIHEISGLTKKQQTTSQLVKSELLKCTPRLVGYDYKSALANYLTSQEHWEQFTKRTCDLVTDTFGQGTAVSATALNCEIELRKENLKRSEKFLAHLRETRSYLLRQNESSEFKGTAVVCN